MKRARAKRTTRWKLMRWKAVILFLIIGIVATFGIRTRRFRDQSQRAQPDGLDRVVEEIRFDDTPLETVFDELSKKYGCPIYADWSALESSYVTRTIPVRLHLFNVTLETALDLLLQQSPRQYPVSWHFDVKAVPRGGAGGIEFTSRYKASNNPLELRMYDVSAIELAAPWHSPMSQIGPSEPLEALRSLVQNEFWDSSGRTAAPQAWLGTLPGHLFVLQTPENHRRIERGLRNLGGMLRAFERETPVNGPSDLLKGP